MLDNYLPEKWGLLNIAFVCRNKVLNIQKLSANNNLQKIITFIFIQFNNLFKSEPVRKSIKNTHIASMCLSSWSKIFCDLDSYSRLTFFVIKIFFKDQKKFISKKRLQLRTKKESEKEIINLWQLYA